MSAFKTELVVEEMDEGIWKVKEELLYESDLCGDKITAPVGFVTDFASVPRVPIAYTLFGNRAHRESVIHDFLYQTHLTDRKRADEIFMEAMKARGKPAYVRWAMYWGVRLGGGSAYRTGPERYTILQDKKSTK